MMDCIDPGVVTPEDLVAYADGEADARTAVHVAACSACAAQAGAYARDQHLLSARLFRVDCPPALTLGELTLDLLDPDATLATRAHLALCPHCRADLAALQTDLRDDPLTALAPAPGRLARIVARLLPAPAVGSAYAGVRGAGENGSRTYEADGVTLSLTVDAEGTGAARRWMLLGLVIDEGGGEVPAGAAVRLLAAGQPAAETTLDEVSNFTFTELADGVYDLELTLGERVIAVEGITVGAAPA
jgi:anti-sigma factor RsiW